MNTGQWGDPKRPAASRWLWIAAVAMAAGLGYYYWSQQKPFTPSQPDPALRIDMESGDPRIASIAETLKDLEPEGPYISNIVIEPGIRAVSGEIPTAGEVKVMFNLKWQSLPGNPDLRQALDTTAARALMGVMRHHPEVTKLRLILKVPKKSGAVGQRPLGQARGHQSAAKVFSFTRAAYEVARTRNDPGSILELGDYVVLTDKGWVRGY